MHVVEIFRFECLNSLRMIFSLNGNADVTISDSVDVVANISHDMDKNSSPTPVGSITQWVEWRPGDPPRPVQSRTSQLLQLTSAMQEIMLEIFASCPSVDIVLLYNRNTAHPRLKSALLIYPKNISCAV